MGRNTCFFGTHTWEVPQTATARVIAPEVPVTPPSSSAAPTAVTTKRETFGEKSKFTCPPCTTYFLIIRRVTFYLQWSSALPPDRLHFVVFSFSGAKRTNGSSLNDACYHPVCVVFFHATRNICQLKTPLRQSEQGKRTDKTHPERRTGNRNVTVTKNK